MLVAIELCSKLAALTKAPGFSANEARDGPLIELIISDLREGVLLQLRK